MGRNRPRVVRSWAKSGRFRSQVRRYRATLRHKLGWPGFDPHRPLLARPRPNSGCNPYLIDLDRSLHDMFRSRTSSFHQCLGCFGLSDKLLSGPHFHKQTQPERICPKHARVAENPSESMSLAMSAIPWGSTLSSFGKLQVSLQDDTMCGVAQGVGRGCRVPLISARGSAPGNLSRRSVAGVNLERPMSGTDGPSDIRSEPGAENSDSGHTFRARCRCV